MRNQRVFFIGLFGLLLSACVAQPQTGLRSIFEGEARVVTSSEKLDLSSEKSAGEQSVSAREKRLIPLMSEYSVAAQTSARVLELSNDKKVTVSFEEIPLKTFVEHVFSNILNIDFVVDPQTVFEDKKVTLQLNEPMGQRDFLNLFKDVIEQHGLGMKLQQNIIFLHDIRARRGLPDYDYGYGRTVNSVPSGSNPIFHIVPIDFIEAKIVLNFLNRLTNVNPELLPDPNLLGLRGGRADIVRALDVINMLDKPAVRGQQLTFIKLDFIRVSLFVEQVVRLLQNEGIDVANSVRFTEVNRQNGVIVHARNSVLLDRIVYWQQELDTPDATDDKQYFLYYPENVEAKQLAAVLEKLVTVPTKTSASSGGSSNSNGVSSTAVPNSSDRGQGVQSVNDLSFITDENRNVIIVFATSSQFETILPLLKKLDVTPPQVLIEARLLEVTLTDQLSQGVDWSLFGGASKRDLPVSQLANLSNGSFSYTVSGVDYNIALTLLQNQDRLKVLSSPRIVVASGEKASINVGTEIPVLATQSADVDTDRVLQSVQYRSTGVDLSVSPTVNSNNVISLAITQNVSETSENASSGIDSPIILNRSFQTTVFANSGQSLVLGGLIRENNSSKDSQVPLLGRLPGLGKLFSSESKSTSRTELIVLITPRILSNTSDIDEIKKLFVDEFTLINTDKR